MTRPDVNEAMDALAREARSMLDSPGLKASGLAAATAALKAYAIHRETVDKAVEVVSSDGLRLPRKGVLDGVSTTIEGHRTSIGNPLGSK